MFDRCGLTFGTRTYVKNKVLIHSPAASRRMMNNEVAMHPALSIHFYWSFGNSREVNDAAAIAAVNLSMSMFQSNCADKGILELGKTCVSVTTIKCNKMPALHKSGNVIDVLCIIPA